MTLAIFDLDHTLLRGDSDSAWLRFLMDENKVDREKSERLNEKFYHNYVSGNLVFEDYAEFAYKILRDLPRPELLELRAKYFSERVKPMICPKASAALAEHRSRGDTTIISTATNEFICVPVFEYLQADHLIATRLEAKDGKFTGRHSGTPNFRDGKVVNINAWLAEHPEHSLAETYFYSDSINDLPLLLAVGHPRPVNVDQSLAEESRKNNWQVQTFNDAA